MTVKNALLIVPVSIALLGARAGSAGPGKHQTALRSAIAFVSTRHDPAADPSIDPERAWGATEIYLIDGVGGNPRRLTTNTVGDGFPALSPDGRRLVFESNRRRAAGDPLNISDLFVMNSDGTDEVWLIRGSSPSWSPDGRLVAFHASASGTGRPIKTDPGAATSDSDIFVVNVSDVRRDRDRRNLTNNPSAIDDDPDWSPDGRTIVFTSHVVTDDPNNSATAEIYATSADGTGQPRRLTDNGEEERAPAWSPDGRRIAFSCRRGGSDFEICVMNANGSGQVQVTDNAVGDLTPSWSPDGKQIVFHRRVGDRGQFQLFVINADGTGEKQMTFPPGLNAFPDWGRSVTRGSLK
jgi:Tol biopolymer transport system component